MHEDCVSLVYRVYFSEVSICSPAVSGCAAASVALVAGSAGMLLYSWSSTPWAAEGKPFFLRTRVWATHSWVLRIDMHAPHISRAKAGARPKEKMGKKAVPEPEHTASMQGCACSEQLEFGWWDFPSSAVLDGSLHPCGPDIGSAVRVCWGGLCLFLCCFLISLIPVEILFPWYLLSC